MHSDQALIRSRSARGTPKRSLITRIGSGKANSAMKSHRPLARRLSISSSTSPPVRRRWFSITRGVNAWLTIRRMRVWSGGSEWISPVPSSSASGAIAARSASGSVASSTPMRPTLEKRVWSLSPSCVRAYPGTSHMLSCGLQWTSSCARRAA